MNLMNVIEVFQFNKEENNEFFGNFNPNESLLYSRLLKLTGIIPTNIVNYSKTVSDIYGLIYAFQAIKEEDIICQKVENLDKKHSWLYHHCVNSLAINPEKQIDFQVRNIITEEFRL